MKNLSGSVLFVGTSGSGKTQCLIEIALGQLKNRKKYVLNDKTGLASQNKNFYSVNWEKDLSSIRNSALICEDLVCLTSKQLSKLTNFVNVTRRHNNNVCLLVTHSLRGNNVFSLIQHMNHFIFTSTRANYSNWKIICRIFELDLDTTEIGKTFFTKIQSGHFYFLHFDCQTLVASIYDSSYKPLVAGEKKPVMDGLSQQELLKRFHSVFKSYKRGDKMYALSHFLVVNLPDQYIAPDLSVKYKGKRISLVDYIQYLSSHDLKPTKNIKRLHQHIVKLLVLPELFILNSNFV